MFVLAKLNLALSHNDEEAKMTFSLVSSDQKKAIQILRLFNDEDLREIVSNLEVFEVCPTSSHLQSPFHELNFHRLIAHCFGFQ